MKLLCFIVSNLAYTSAVVKENSCNNSYSAVLTDSNPMRILGFMLDVFAILVHNMGAPPFKLS